MARHRSKTLVLSTLLIAALPISLPAEDHFLTIGGGYSPTGNQISLEKNVLLFQQLVEEQYPGDVRHDVYFADGDDAARDIQFEDEDLPIPRAQLLLAQIFRQTKYLRNRYRSHEIPDVRGATSRDNVTKWFDGVGSKLQPGDRLFVYVTAHGGRSTDKKQPQNTKLYLWNRQNLQLSEWVASLDKLPEEVAVVTVMVQCYCGGFANIVFNEGDAKKGYSKANRCGFFATTHDRPAAGCTPDINEENYHEYSTYFWEAIRGETRTGQPVERPDFDEDGDVSFAEAHAHALLTSSSVDISIKTSDAFLRAHSKTKVDKQVSKKDGKTKTPEAEEALDLLTPDEPFERLVELASPPDRAVLEGLSLALGLTKPERAKEAKAAASQLLKEKKELDAKYKKKSGEYTTAANNIRQRLTKRWPELYNRWHPAVTTLLAEESEELIKAVESHADFARLDKLRKAQKDLAEQKLNLDRRWAKCQRLTRTLENVALAANLAKVAPTDAHERYQQLVAAESGSFGRQKPKPALDAGADE